MFFNYEEFKSLAEKENLIVDRNKYGAVYFGDEKTGGEKLLGYVEPSFNYKTMYIKIPKKEQIDLDEFKNTKEMVDYIIKNSKTSVRKSMKESTKRLDKLVDEICSEVEKTVGHRKYVETFLQGIDFSRVDEGIIDEDYEYASDGLDDVFYYYEESLNDDEYYEKYGDIFTDKVVDLLNELKKELSKFTESNKSVRKSLKESNETNLIDSVATKLKDEKTINAKIDTYRGADWIYIIKDDYKIEIFYRRKELSIQLYNIKDYNENLVDSEFENAYGLSDDDFSVNYVIDFIKNFIKNRNYLKNKISIEESKSLVRKSIKESADDNWYKLKMLNEMLDAMAKDEYNIPKLGIYGVTKNINLDEGAIRTLIKYYK